MCYINSCAASSMVGQWKINCSLLVCSKSLPEDGGNNLSSSQQMRTWRVTYEYASSGIFKQPARPSLLLFEVRKNIK